MAMAEMMKQYPEPARPTRAAITDPHIMKLSFQQQPVQLPRLMNTPAGRNINTPPPPIPIMNQISLDSLSCWTYWISPPGKNSRMLAMIQHTARGRRAKPSDRAKPMEHIGPTTQDEEEWRERSRGVEHQRGVERYHQGERNGE